MRGLSRRDPSASAGHGEDFESWARDFEAFVGVTNYRMWEILADYTEKTDNNGGAGGHTDFAQLTENYEDFDAESGANLTRDEEQAARPCKQLDFLLLTAPSPGARVIVAETPEHHGCNAWRRFRNRDQTRKNQTSISARHRIISMRLSESDYENSLTLWEREVGKWERSTGTILTDAVKVAIVMCSVDGPFKDYLLLNCNDAMTYQVIRASITNYVNARKLQKGPIPMEVGNYEYADEIECEINAYQEGRRNS